MEQKDLFGNSERKKLSSLENSLRKYDRESFAERFKRLKYLNKIFPSGYGLLADPETVYIFDEVKMAFINGEMISTILLAQAFIERKIQSHYHSAGFETIATKGLKAIIDHARKNKTINDFILDKINILRQKRNPFVHLKEYDHEHNLSQRLYKNIKEKKVNTHPLQIIEQDSREAIEIMYLIFVSDL
jgi:hypothetical protein